MPMIAISGRWRFGGFNAAIVASVSSLAIGGAARTPVQRAARGSRPAAIAARSASGRQTAPQYKAPFHSRLSFDKRTTKLDYLYLYARVTTGESDSRYTPPVPGSDRPVSDVVPCVGFTKGHTF